LQLCGNYPKKQTLFVGVRKFSIESLSINGMKKNRLRSALLNTGGDSNASSSRVLNILILAMRQSHQVKNVLELFIL